MVASSGFPMSMPKRLLTTLTWLSASLAGLSGSGQQAGHEYAEAARKNTAEAVLKHFPPAARHEAHMLPMKDGTPLAVDVFTPPGPGPWPVILAKGYYGHFSTASYAAPCKQGDIAFVTVDARGRGKSGKGLANAQAPEFESGDCGELLDWISRQPWCNGRIGMQGGSGNGVAAYAAFLTKHPHLTTIAVANSSAFPFYYWGFHNGVKRASLYHWLEFTGLPVDEWPKPTLHPPDPAPWRALLASAGSSNSCVVVATAGWFDIVSEAALDLFAQCGSEAKVFVTIGPASHAGELPFTFPRCGGTRVATPSFEAILRGATALPTTSAVTYFVMGDRNTHSPTGAGNVFKTSPTWPPAGVRATDFFLGTDGSLSRSCPTATEARLSYVYDPADPAPTLGGNWMYSRTNMGPCDQRPLRQRKDVLRFVSPPLAVPVEIAGKVFAELFISTDAPDTEFVVKLVDVYPDGYEMLVRETAGMARYATGLHTPSPMERGATRALHLDLWSTAIAFNPGHRIGFYVTSSSKEAYEVHPNTWDPVGSITLARVATNSVHCSGTHPSRLILPLANPVP